MESPSDVLFGLIAQNYALLIMLMTFAFLYASFGRLKIFHYNRAAQTIVAFVLALGTAGVIHSIHWNQLTQIVAALTAAGLVLMVLWAVTLQRGRTMQEDERRHDERVRGRRGWF